MKRFWTNNYVRWGLTIAGAGAFLVVFYRIVANFTGFREGLSTLMAIISPFIYGFVMAYLLSPIYNFIVRKTYPKLKDATKNNKRALMVSRILATIVSLIILLGAVFGLMALLIPQIVDSVRGISQTLPSNLDDVSNWINSLVAGMEDTRLANTIREGIYELQDNMLAWVQNTFLPGVGSFMQRVSSSVILTIKTFFNIAIGVIACVYFLNGKDVFRAQCRKMVLAIAGKSRAEEVFEFVQFTNKTFGDFISGKVMDSIIVGLICFVAMNIFKLPYPLLISTIVGVTNIIPFFGPFIGAIPSIGIIFLTEPIQALWFLILIVVLQQLDGNIIGPKIIGSSIGLGSFWVMFAIIIGGGLFGFIGMVLGVPVFAVIYYYLGRLVEKKLRKKAIPETTEDYIDYDGYAIDKRELEEDEVTE